MTESITREEREEIVALLERLGSDEDQDVLEAARALHAKIDQAGGSWEALLLGDHEDDVAAPPDDAEEVAAPVVIDDEHAAETLRLLDTLLAKGDISEDFREELEGYKADMAAGELDGNDHRYIRAVFKRLTG